MLFGRHGVLLALALVAAPAFGITVSDAQRIKDPDGKTLAVIVKCNDCKTKGDKGPCLDGTKDGYLEGEPCGDCLANANYNARLQYAHDISIIGVLKDAQGKPLENQFVRVQQPNGWSTTGRAFKDGKFRLTLGATLARKSKTPIVVDLGTLTYKHTEGKSGAFNLFLLPDPFKPCAPKGAKGTAKTSKP